MNKIRSGVDTSWRRVASALYSRPRDSKIFGSVELDVTTLESFIARKRGEGLKITLTHVFLLAIARAIHERVPEFNTRVLRGRIVPRQSLEASLSVLIPGKEEMSSIRLGLDESVTLATLAGELADPLRSTRMGEEQAALQIKERLAALPWPLRGWLVQWVGWLTIDLGLNLGWMGLPHDRFGCFLLSNIGSIGLDVGYPSLFPNANVSLVVTMGSVQTLPRYIAGELQPRRILTMSAAMDHRLVDGLHGGRLFQYLKKVAAQPDLLEAPLSRTYGKRPL